MRCGCSAQVDAWLAAVNPSLGASAGFEVARQRIPDLMQNNKSRRRPTTGRVLGRGFAGCIAVCLRIPGRALQLPCASSQDSVVRKLLIDRWPHE
jgi:hypothetical protein